MRTRGRAAVVGCGFAGGATALFLDAAGFAVSVFERVREPGPVGAGIMLQPTGMAVLSRLGVLEPVLERAERVDRLRCVTAKGRTLFSLPYELRAPGLFGLGLHRGTLFTTLFEAVQASAAAVELGVAIEDLTNDERPTLIDSEGRRWGPFDLVVVADGADSRLRAKVLPDVRQAPYPWGALWYVSPDPQDRYKEELFQVVDGTHTMMGLLPTGRGPGRDARRVVSLFWSLHRDAVDDFRRGELDAWKERARSLMPSAEPILEDLESFDQLLFADYRDVRMWPFHSGRVVVIGDSAHAMSPQLGQGSNLALMDALVLDEALAESADVSAALAAYSRKRRAHLSFYTRMNRLLTPFFQSDGRLLGRLRDALLPIVSRTPGLRGQMVATMCGVKLGPFRSLPLVEEELRAP